MDQSPEQASIKTGDLEDSPASRVKGRARGNRSRGPATPKARRGRVTKGKKKAPARAESAVAPLASFQLPSDTRAAVATETQPSRLLHFIEPIESWQEPPTSPPPQKSPTSQSSLGIFGLPRDRPSALISPLESQENSGSYRTPWSSGSEAVRKEFAGEVHHTNDSSMSGSSKQRIVQNSVNGKCEMNKTSSAPSSRPLSFTDGSLGTPSSVMLSGVNSPLTTRNGSTASLEIALDGLNPGLTEWRPAGLLCKDDEELESQYALLILNQPIENINLLKLIWEKAFFRIAADGGGNRLERAFRDPCLSNILEGTGLEVICGDLDSLDDSVRQNAEQRGTRIIKDKNQNTTDFTKCMEYLRKTVFPTRTAVSNTVCLGGLGGRVDQAFSQLHHLYMEQKDPDYKNGRVYLLSTEAITFVLRTGKHRIRVRDPQVPSVLGKHIGIIPLREPSMITTKGLEWDVTNWLTELGGQMSTSNHVREDIVEIRTTGDVLFTIDLDFPPGDHTHPELRQRTSPILSMADDMFFGTVTDRYHPQVRGPLATP